MLVLLLGVEACMAWREPAWMSLCTLIWNENGRAAAREPARSEIVCFGDSLVLNGLTPAVLEARIGKRAHNLAVPKAPAVAHLFLLRRMLRAGARPGAILIDGDFLDCNPLDTDLAQAWAALATLPESAELAWYARDPKIFKALAAARFLPTYRRRSDIRAVVVAGVTGKTTLEGPLIAPLRRNLAKNRGAYLFPAPAVPAVPDPRPAQLSSYRPTGWAVNPMNDRYLADFLDLTAARGIPVFWLLPPVHPDFQAARDRFGRDAAYLGFVRRLAERYPHVVVIDGRHSGYPAEAVNDFMHLNRRGAVAFSVAVARVVNDRLASPPRGDRWVDLPAYRDEPPAVALEDFAGSSAAVNRRRR